MHLWELSQAERTAHSALPSSSATAERRTAIPITWHCAKIDRAEDIALKYATEIAINFKSMLLEETNMPEKLLDIQIFCDNHHVVSSIFTTKVTD